MSNKYTPGTMFVFDPPADWDRVLGMAYSHPTDNELTRIGRADVLVVVKKVNRPTGDIDLIVFHVRTGVVDSLSFGKDSLLSAALIEVTTK